MTLEERLRALAKKGEFVHLSVAFSNGAFHCNFAAASPQAGYSVGVDGNDPVAAIEKALAASPVKTRRPHSKPEAREDITAAVNEEDARDMSANPDDDISEWSKP